MQSQAALNRCLVTYFTVLAIAFYGVFSPAAASPVSIKPVHGIQTSIIEEAKLLFFTPAGIHRGTSTWSNRVFGSDKMVYKADGNFFISESLKNGNRYGSGEMARKISLDVDHWDANKTYQVVLTQPLQLLPAWSNTFPVETVGDIGVAFWPSCGDDPPDTDGPNATPLTINFGVRSWKTINAMGGMIFPPGTHCGDKKLNLMIFVGPAAGIKWEDPLKILVLKP